MTYQVTEKLWEKPLIALGRVFLWGSVCFWLVFVLAPVVVTIVSSFTAAEFLTFPPKGFSLRWYFRVMELDWFLTSLQTSLIVATVSTFIATVFAVLAARVLTRHRFRAKGAFEILMLSPLIIPGVVFGFAFFNVVLQFRLEGLSLLNLFVAHSVVTIPLMLRPIWSSMAGTELSLEEAAQSLGATPWTTFWKITFPMILPGIVAGAIIAFTFSFNDITIAIFLVGPETQTLPVQLMSQIEYTPDASPAAITSIIIFFTLILFFIIDRTVGMDVFAQK
ncbi:ABC transporter permease [Hoeflea poritis]|uniref:ABC transporter permease n=1 Tax=Hoeflea poritis TaxID=2993659 RepID=A0ABT4VR34_9HYPH|nr:ABC transporter permease [Hoeflea poritis]MDA4847167.1 ABC transporter permease [Hoeflea poritis]